MHHTTRILLRERTDLDTETEVGVILVGEVKGSPLLVDNEVIGFVDRRYGKDGWRWMKTEVYNNKGEFWYYGTPYILASDGRCLSFHYGFFDVPERPEFSGDDVILDGLFLKHLTVEVSPKYEAIRLTDPNQMVSDIHPLPILDPFEGWTQAEIDALENNSPEHIAFFDYCQRMEQAQKELAQAEPLFLYGLIGMAIEGGYSQREHGTRVYAWIIDRLARFVAHQMWGEDEVNA